MFPWVLALAPVTWVQKPALHALGFRSDLEYFAVSFTENLFVSLVYPASGLLTGDPFASFANLSYACSHCHCSHEHDVDHSSLCSLEALDLYPAGSRLFSDSDPRQHFPVCSGVSSISTRASTAAFCGLA